MTEVLTLDLRGWLPALAPAVQEAAVRALEGGGVVVVPRASFEPGLGTSRPRASFAPRRT